MRAGPLDGGDDRPRETTTACRAMRRSTLLATLAFGAAFGAACGGDAGARAPDGGGAPAARTGAATRPPNARIADAAAGEVVAGAPAAATSDPATASLVEEAVAAGDAELAADWRASVPAAVEVTDARRTTVLPVAAGDGAGDAPRTVAAGRPRATRADRERRRLPRAVPRTVAIPTLPDFGPPGRPTVPLDEPAPRRSGLLDHWAEPGSTLPPAPPKPNATGPGALRRAARWLVGREASGGARDTGAPRPTPQGTGEPGPTRPRQPAPCAGPRRALVQAFRRGGYLPPMTAPVAAPTSPLAERLRATGFLAGLPDAHVWRLSKAVTVETLPAGATVWQEGDARRRFLILLDGTVAVEKTAEGRATRLTTLGAGEVVGEGLLLGDTGEHGTALRTLTPVEAAVLTRQQLDDITREFPPLYAALVGRAARAIAQRLREADATLVGRGRTLGFSGGATRREHDLLGERDVPADALYGIQTLRALENFPITGVPLREFASLVSALAAVKIAATRANAELGLLDAKVADAVVAAAEEVRAGRHHEHFLVDMIQGGAGTSTNMNANEVIANRACELLDVPRGRYDVVHPNNHVNLSQSTNDVYPTAIKLALHRAIDELREAMRTLADAFRRKAVEFAPHLKMGRTQLQDAVPMTLGQEFGAFAHTILEDVDRLGEVQGLLREINMGATAIGTGINAPTAYAEGVRRHLAALTGLPLITAPDLVEATADTGVFVQLSGVLKRCAVKLSKICNDLRLLSSGPRAGLGEINLPPMQPGSSIMPGKVNPVIPEVVNQVCFDVIGGDVTVTMAAEAGQLQLNVFEPIIAFRLLRGIQSLRNACMVLRERCVDGITANPDRMRWFVEHSVGIVTALVPVIGYENATDIAKTALETGRGVYDLVCDRGLMTREQLDAVLRPESMIGATTV